MYPHPVSVPSGNPRYQALIQLLRTAEDLWNASRVFFARWHLSPSQFNVLNLLHAHPQGLSQSDLSRWLIMHRSNATGLVDRMQLKGWVERHDHPEDRRAYRVRLTPAGRSLVDHILPHYYAAAERVWDQTPAPEVETLLQQLHHLAAHATAVAALAQASQPPAPQPHSRPPKPTPKQRPATPTSHPLPAPPPLPTPQDDPDALRTSDL